MKKLIHFSLALLVMALGFSAPTFACEDSESTETNCIEESTSAAETVESIEEVPILVSPALDSESLASSADEAYAEANAKVLSSRSLAHSLFLAGSEVVSSDSIAGADFLAGNLVEFSGSADYGFFAGNSVKISGTIANDLFVAGNAVEITEDALISRDVFAFGNVLTLKTNLYGNAFLAGNRLVLEDVTIDGDLSTDFEEIVIKGRVAVSGTFKYPENATVAGLENLSASSTEPYAVATVSTPTFFSKFKSELIFFIGRLVVVLIFLALAPKFSKKLLDSFRFATSWKYLALGLGLLVAVPIAALFIILTIVGIPLGCLAIGLYFTLICLASSMTGGIVGDQLAKALFKKPKMSIYAKFSLGMALLFLASFIPVLGSLVSALATCFGFGYLAKYIFAKKK